MTEEIEDIQVALSALIEAALQADADSRRGQRQRPRILDFDDIDPPREDSADFARNPVGTACRFAIERLGRRLHSLGGEDLMENVLGEVACLKPNREDLFSDVLDKAWDGIGEWIA